MVKEVEEAYRMQPYKKFFRIPRNYPDYPIIRQKLFSFPFPDVYLIKYICKHSTTTHIFDVWIRKIGYLPGVWSSRRALNWQIAAINRWCGCLFRVLLLSIPMQKCRKPENFLTAIAPKRYYSVWEHTKVPQQSVFISKRVN